MFTVFCPNTLEGPSTSQTHRLFALPVFPTALEPGSWCAFCLRGVGRWAKVLMGRPQVRESPFRGMEKKETCLSGAASSIPSVEGVVWPMQT